MELRSESAAWPSWTVDGRQLADLEALIAGFLRPAIGYAGRRDRPSVAGGPMLPAPALYVTPDAASLMQPGRTVGLRDPEGVLLAALHVADTWDEDGAWRTAGAIEGVALPAHHDFRRLRLGIQDVAARAAGLGWSRSVAFFPGQVLHAGTREALVHLASDLDAGALVVFAVDPSRPDDLSFFARVRALEVSAGKLRADRTLPVLVPVGMPDDPDEAGILQAVVARNLGASACAVDLTARPIPQSVLDRAADAAGVRWLPLQPWGFDVEKGVLAPPRGAGIELPPSEPRILASVAAAQAIPDWLLSREEIEALRHVRRPNERLGFTVFFTGLSGSGKSTIAGALRHRLMELTGRPVTLLDGDVVRRHLSSELGFSREHRDLNVRRIGWVASEITRHGGIALCAPIAPYDVVRKQVRAMVEPVGGFALVHVATSLEVCEQRDRKGLYARARAGLIPQFTGVSDPYEAPEDAAVQIDTATADVDAACQAIVDWLEAAGYLSP